jgi:hypothetical protein
MPFPENICCTWFAAVYKRLAEGGLGDFGVWLLGLYFGLLGFWTFCLAFAVGSFWKGEELLKRKSAERKRIVERKMLKRQC